jgi:hypothetical protein
VSPAEIVVVTPQALISILAPYAREGSTVKVHIREEALSQALAEQLGGRSATAIATVQCPTGGVSIGAVEVYPGNNLSGGQAKSVSAFAWMAANESVEPGKIAQKACGGGARSAASDSMNGTGRDNATPPGSPPPSRPAVIEAGARWAQIGAFASPELAQSSWAKLQKRWPTATQSLSERTQLVTVRGASVHRSLVGPFPSLSSARAFCGMLIAQGADCLVR